MKYRIIANPMAGKGNARLLIPRVEQRLRELGLDFDLVCTERPGHATELAQEAAADGIEIIVAAGGDGTFNEVLNGMMAANHTGATRPGLGLICIGRGNDFAFSAGIPTNWEQDCQALARGHRRRIDVGRVMGDCLKQNGGRYFGNGVGIGFDATVNVEATKSPVGGFIGYLIAALRTILLNFKSPQMQIELDDRVITQPTIMLSIMNGRRLGGGFYTTPDSVVDDGTLDLCIAHQVNRPTILMIIPLFMRGTQGTHPAIRFARSRRVVVTALTDEMPFHVDGESICMDAHQLTVEIIPGGIELIA